MSCTTWITFSSKLQQSEERNYWKPPSNALFSHQLGAHGRIIGRLGGGSVCNNLLSNVCVSLPCCINNSEGSHLLNTCVLKSVFFSFQNYDSIIKSVLFACMPKTTL
uniref:Uncharacterized protein n=1 Tax=Macaca fascicularis TaxID=9541 RepID=A0A7N9DAG8_MACFA